MAIKISTCVAHSLTRGTQYRNVDKLEFSNYQPGLFESILTIDANAAEKSLAHMYLARIVSANKTTLSFEVNRTKLIVEVLPNGTKYDIPIEIVLHSKSEHISNKADSSRKTDLKSE